jgi:mono/diheme cytochrome c family protein
VKAHCVGTLVLVILLGSVATPRKTAAAERDDRAVTFSKDIAPIVLENCAACHRPGEVAPFPLLTYVDVSKRAEQIRDVTARGLMPPTKSVAGTGPYHQQRRLSTEQLELIDLWTAAGAPQGDPAELPPVPEFSQGWQLGQPDIVLQMPYAYEMPAEGRDVYRNFLLPLEIPEGRYIRAIEFRPSNRRIVHHAVLSVDTTGEARRRQAETTELGFDNGASIVGRLLPGNIAIWTPGWEPLPMPEPFSVIWPPEAELVLQLHLSPSGKPEREQSTIGIYLTDQPPRRTLVDWLLIDTRIDIPPGEAAYRTEDELVLPVDIELFGTFPHMHLIGREVKVTAFPPQGEPEVLLWIDDWDFNWQNFYQFIEPRILRAGTRLKLQGLHDNSADNFRNPHHPPRRVRWGEQTSDEMSLVFLQGSPLSESDWPPASEGNKKHHILSVQPAVTAPSPQSP